MSIQRVLIDGKWVDLEPGDLIVFDHIQKCVYVRKLGQR